MGFPHVVSHVVFSLFNHLIESVLPVHALPCDTENISNHWGSEDASISIIDMELQFW